MTNKEIDKLISILDKKNLDELKKYLLKEKELNTNKLRQKTFEKYLTTNVLSYNDKSLPKLYSEKNIQIFTNYISIYIINKNFFKTNTPYLSREKNNSRTLPHKYELVTIDEINSLLKKIKMNIGQCEFDILTMENNIKKPNIYEVEYYDDVDKKKKNVSFSKKEIDTADILLNYPKYIIYKKTPIIKAESEIGKCYILGYKK